MIHLIHFCRRTQKWINQIIIIIFRKLLTILQRKGVRAALLRRVNPRKHAKKFRLNSAVFQGECFSHLAKMKYYHFSMSLLNVSIFGLYGIPTNKPKQFPHMSSVNLTEFLSENLWKNRNFSIFEHKFTKTNGIPYV